MSLTTSLRFSSRKVNYFRPEHGFEFDVDENTSVELGQFCCIEIENNVPKKITKEETRMEGLTVFVKKDLALVRKLLVMESMNKLFRFPVSLGNL